MSTPRPPPRIPNPLSRATIRNSPVKSKLGSLPVGAGQERLEGVRPHGTVVGAVHHGSPAGRGYANSNDRQLAPRARLATAPGSVQTRVPPCFLLERGPDNDGGDDDDDQRSGAAARDSKKIEIITGHDQFRGSGREVFEFSRNESGRVRRWSKTGRVGSGRLGSGRVGSGQDLLKSQWSGWVESGLVQISRVGSGQDVFKSHGQSEPTPDMTSDPTREERWKRKSSGYGVRQCPH